ncbi:MAG: hypothetical protein DRH32_06815 [Deltaproteobacteria bacterium]|nr:MAG: hypothetical protein DRH32_06815 [Deltaproteobacteria bacterium]
MISLNFVLTLSCQARNPQPFTCSVPLFLKNKGSVSLEIILDTGRENGLYEPELLKQIEETSAYLETLKVGEIFAGKAWSLTTILKETNRALNENRMEFYTIPENRNLIAQELLLFETAAPMIWRILQTAGFPKCVSWQKYLSGMPLPTQSS